MKLIEALNLLRRAPAGAEILPATLICGFTAQPLATFFAAHLQALLPNRKVEPREGRFGDLAGNLDRYLARPEGAAAVVLEWPDLDSRLGWREQGGWGRSRVAEITGVVESRLRLIRSLLERSAEAGTIAVALPSLPVPPVEPVPGWQYGNLEARLDALTAEFTASIAPLRNIRIVSPARLNAASPCHRRLDVKALNHGGFPYQLPHADALAQLLAQCLNPPPPRKGVITDLDNTLWSGILGEVGLKGITWDQERHTAHFGAYQQMLQSLADSGVLVAVASKNDPKLAADALQRPDLLLRPESIFPVEAHWQPKSESVARILDRWNIAADAVLFVDDSAFELAEVRSVHPTIDCRQFPSDDPQAVAALLFDLADLFGKPFDSDEDAVRLGSLRAASQIRGQSEIASSESLEEMLATAGGRLTIAPVHIPPDPRALELLNKTNQFNLNGRRWREYEWLDYLRRPDHFVWIAAYEDRFGPLGKISVLAAQLAGDHELAIDAWVLSCRAFARRIEHAFLAALFKQLGVRRIHFRFQATDRNGPLQELLAELTGAPPTGHPALTLDRFEHNKPSCYTEVHLTS